MARSITAPLYESELQKKGGKARRGLTSPGRKECEVKGLSVRPKRFPAWLQGDHSGPDISSILQSMN
jgi:hypothetical protein